MSENANSVIKKNGFNEIVIIGTGLAGLTCAWKLSSKGYNVTLLEKQNFPGGLASSIKINDYTIDFGPHYLVLPQNSDTSKEVKAIMGNDLIEFTDFLQSHKAYVDGRLKDHYPTLYEIIFHSGLKNFLFSITSFITSKILHCNKKTNSGKKYVIYNYGKFLYEKWFKPYYANFFVNEDLPLHIIKKQFPTITLQKIISLVKRKKDENIKNISRISEFYDCYPKYGMSSLVEKLTDKIIENGGKIILNVNIKTIEHGNKKKIQFQIKDEHSEIFPEKIIYALSPSLCLKWFDNVPESISTKINLSNRYHSIMIFLFVNTHRVFDGWIVNIYDPEIIFFRISQQNYLSKEIAPKGKSLITVEIKCNASDEIWNKSESEIFIQVKSDLSKTCFFPVAKIEDYKIMKFPFLYPKLDTVESNDSESVEFINSHKDEFAVGGEIDIEELESDELSEVHPRKKHRLGGMYLAMANANDLIKKIND